MKLDMENGKAISVPSSLIYGIVIGVIAYFATQYFEGSVSTDDARVNTEMVLLKEAVNRNNAKIDQFIGKVEAQQSQIAALNIASQDRWTSRDHTQYAERQMQIDEAQNKLILDLQSAVKILENKINK